MTTSIRCPEGWDITAQTHWLGGNKQAAVDSVLSMLNRHGLKKPVDLVIQLAYYMYLAGDPASAAVILASTREYYPANLALNQNLAVCLARSGQHERAVDCWQDVLALQPDTVLAYDSLSYCLYESGRKKEAAEMGTRALVLKDKAHGSRPPGWNLPHARPSEWVSGPSRKNVIAFSLWGDHPRYLRGAIDNALAVSDVYPGWRLRFFVDETVPSEVRDALATLGADVFAEPPGQSTLQRLAWRFKVANDPDVGRFLVRDVDSVIHLREKLAVEEWIASDRWFHVMRDWWSHTDLILAGMWGGVAGVLPSLPDMLDAYKAPAMETPNIDQWFLRDKIWACVRMSCLVHDRCFTPSDAKPWPSPDPIGDTHVGQNVFAAQREAQEKRLARWIDRLACLRLPQNG